MVINERLTKELEEKNILSESQAEFRKGRGTMDNIYILDHIVRKYATRRKSDLFCFFVDLKAAFDRVCRTTLWSTMEKLGVSGTLVKRIKEIYQESKNAVRTNGDISRWFWTDKGVRQGCPLSPSLFAIMIADMEKVLTRSLGDIVKIGEEKITNLAYADDIVLIAKSEESLKVLMEG